MHILWRLVVAGGVGWCFAWFFTKLYYGKDSEALRQPVQWAMGRWFIAATLVTAVVLLFIVR